MRYILIFLFSILALSSNAQNGFSRPEYTGWPIDSNLSQTFKWNPTTYKAVWALDNGTQDSIIITSDSICVIYLGDTTCVSADSDSFYLSGDTSLCVISMGDTLCSPYSSSGGNIYTMNGALNSHRTLEMGSFSLKFSRINAALYGNINFPQPGLWPIMSISSGLVPNELSPTLTLASNGYGDLYQHFGGSADQDYSIGVAKDISLNPFTIAEGEDIGGSAGRPMMQFYGAGDSIVVANNLLAAGSAFRIRSHSTAAASNTQKGLEVFLRGANATAAQSTYAGYFENTHGGTSPFNYGIYATTNAGLGASISGNNTGGGVSVEGVSTGSGTGIYGYSPAGLGVYGLSASSSGAARFSVVPTSTTGSATIVGFTRETSGTATDGIEGQIPIQIETSTGAIQTANIFSSQWSTADNSTRHSKMILYGVSNAATNTLLTFEGDKRVRFNGRAEEQQGADVASVAGAIALGYDGNTFEITGTNAITLISNLGWQNGSTITLLFTSTASLTDGTANSGTDIGFELAGNANFTGSATDAITLRLAEIGGTQRWYEVSRSIN